MPKLVLILLEKPPLLTDSQLKVLADICVAAGQLTAASMVIPFVIPNLDNTKLSVVIIGVVATFALWMLSVLSVRRIKNGS